MQANWLAALAEILKHEGGFVDNPDDPGGATNRGITIGTLAAWRGEPVTAADVAMLSESEAAAIYRARYWNQLQCDRLPDGVDLVTFDFGVNAGPARAAKMLQLIVAAEPDGVIGPATIHNTRRRDRRAIIERFSEDRLIYYRGLGTWPIFGKGWASRVESVKNAALAMGGGV